MSEQRDRFSMLRRGGQWLAAARCWIQNTRIRGSYVTWGSTETLTPHMTVRDVEELAADVAAAALDEYERKYLAGMNPGGIALLVQACEVSDKEANHHSSCRFYSASRGDCDCAVGLARAALAALRPQEVSK